MSVQRRYAATTATVIRAQRRVLKLALNTIGRMSKRDLFLLRACGDGGVITLNELSVHIVGALHLKVRMDRLTTGQGGLTHGYRVCAAACCASRVDVRHGGSRHGARNRT